MGLDHLANSRTQRLFLSMFSDSIRAVNQKRDSSGLTFVRKAMIRCGLTLGLGGPWCVGQLSSELQEIIRQHPREFAGEESSVRVPSRGVESCAITWRRVLCLHMA
jgi:hypothetical protein